MIRMSRDSLADSVFWDKWIGFGESAIVRDLGALQESAKNPIYRPQFVWDMAYGYQRLLLRRYSRGDAVSELAPLFQGILEMWELSNHLAADVCHEHGLATCRDWTFDLSNLNHYQWCFGLAGLALALEVPDAPWQRLLALVGGEGEDALLDRVIARRQPGRRIGTALLHGKPYGRLLACLDAPGDRQAGLLRDFVEHWYAELDRPGKARLWWYDYGDPEQHPLALGSYFGRWCLEAAGVAKAFGIDDAACLEHHHYPGDLVRDGRSPRYPDPVPPAGLDMSGIEFNATDGIRPGRSWLSRWLLGPNRRR